ncbi:MAG: LapA family protein [Aquificae bacterium]|nr:LapA family protein [Aquificota bacterium]
MKGLLALLAFVVVFGLSFYFFLMNSSQSVEVLLWNGVRTPAMPVGLVILIAFFLGFLAGMLFFLLTYIIKRLSS